jgi:threonine/homoserine/homoserine lactone efflux protein
VPDGTTLAVFAVAAFALIIVPGPNVLYIVTRGVSGGRLVGLVSVAGVAAGVVVHVLAAALGLSALIASSALALGTLKYCGAIYLAYIGIRTLLRHDGAIVAGPVEERRLGRAFVQGALTNILNPKVTLFFLAFLPQFIDPARGNPTTQILVLGFVFFAIGLCSDSVYAVAAGSLGAWLQTRHAFWRRQRFFTGGVYLALAAVAAFAHVERVPKGQAR